MRRIKKFIKSACISSKILFAVCFFFALFIKSTEQSKILTMFEMGVVFLLPTSLICLRRSCPHISRKPKASDFWNI